MAESRLRQFKNKGRDDSALRRRRQEQTVELRKNKRMEALSKRRHVDSVEDGVGGDPLLAGSGMQGIENSSSVMPASSHDLPPEKIEKITNALMCLQAKTDTRAAMETVRRLVASTDTIDEIIRSGLLKEVVAAAVASQNVHVLTEFSWILTNVTSGSTEQTEAVVDLGCVPILVTLLQHQQVTIQHQSLWALGNIAGNSAAHRDQISQAGVLEYVSGRLQSLNTLSRRLEHWDKKVLLLIPWVLSNLCRFNNPSPSVELASVIIPMLVTVMLNESQVFSQTELRDCCWGLSYLTDGYPDDNGVDPLKELMAVKFDLVPLVMTMLQRVPTSNVSVLVPCVRCLGNLCSGTDTQTALVVNAGILGIIGNLLKPEVDRLIIKESVWMLSNCLSNSLDVVQAVASSGLLENIFGLMRTASFVVQKECAWAIRNFVTVGAPHMTPFFLHAGAVGHIHIMISYDDNQIVQCGLEALHKTLASAGDLLEDVLYKVEEAGSLDKLEILQCSNNASIAAEAFAITDEYFASEENPSLLGMAPSGNAEEFTFSAPALPPVTL